MKKIVDGLLKEYDGCVVFFILFIKNGGQWIEVIVDIGCVVVGLDWIVELGDIRQRVGDKIVLQGNMDLLVLYVFFDSICKEVV